MEMIHSEVCRISYWGYPITQGLKDRYIALYWWNGPQNVEHFHPFRMDEDAFFVDNCSGQNMNEKLRETLERARTTI